MEEEVITLDGAVVTREVLNEKVANVQNGEKIIEVAPNVYKTLKRMQG